MSKHNETDALCQQIRHRYIARRNMHVRMLDASAVPVDESKIIGAWDGGENHRGVRKTAVWPRLAKVAKSEKLNVDRWVEAVFSMAYMFDHIPRPDDMLNNSVISRTRNWRELASLDLHFVTRTGLHNMFCEQWHRQQSLLLSPQAIARTLIADPTSDASAIVRYAMAVKYAQEDLVALLESAALVEYRADRRAYELALGDSMPSRLLDVDKQTREEKSDANN